MTILILRKVLLHLVAILQLHLRSEISLLPASKPSHALALHTFVVALRHKMLAEFPAQLAVHKLKEPEHFAFVEQQFRSVV